MIAMLRAASPALDLEACLRWLPAERLDASWRVGDASAGKRRQTAGFNLLLSEAEDAAVAVAGAQHVLSSLAKQVKALVDGGVGVSVDIGIDVYGIGPKSVALSSGFLLLIAETGAELVFSAYPCSTEE